LKIERLSSGFLKKKKRKGSLNSWGGDFPTFFQGVPRISHVRGSCPKIGKKKRDSCWSHIGREGQKIGEGG